MALTREIELRLERASLIKYFNANRAAWQAAAQDAFDYTKKAFAGAPIRCVDRETCPRTHSSTNSPTVAVMKLSSIGP